MGAGVPSERIPLGIADVEDRIFSAERNTDDGVERHDEQGEEPQRAGRDEQAPEPRPLRLTAAAAGHRAQSPE